MIVKPDKIKIYLAVPFAEKDDAKTLGAKFDWDAKKWYILSDHKNFNIIHDRWKINTNPVVLVGEDRTFGGNDLFVDLIPRSCWFTNVRYCVHSSDWDRLKKYVYERTNYTCECCNASTMDLEAHERWEYDDKTNVQRLVRLVALCHMCHTTTHIGKAGIDGKGEEALKHLMKVRNFTRDEAINHKNDAFELWAERSSVDWKLDLSLITNNNIKLDKKVDVNDRANIVQKNLMSLR